MGCFSCVRCSRDKGDDPKLIVDVEQTLADAAWDMFLSTYGSWQRRWLRRKDFIIEVPMNYYLFEQKGPQVFRPKKRPAGAVDAGCSTQPSKSALQGKQLAHRDQTSPEQVGLETVFNNDTDRDQTYNFSFTKTRKASITVSVQKGYSLGGKANFSLGLPKVLSDNSLGLEMNMNVQVSKTTGETFEESVTTTANSNITVAQNSHYTASVLMEERSLLADFKLDIVMSVPAQVAPVYVKERKTGEVVFVYSVNSLVSLFDKFPNVERVRDEAGKVVAQAVEFHIEGLVDGMQLSSHRINLSGHGISKDTDSPGKEKGKGKGKEGEEAGEERDGGGSSPEH